MENIRKCISRSRLSENVSVTCYGKTDEMKRGEALAFYFDCMCNSEGPEHERYETIFFQLMFGLTAVSDQVDFRYL